MVRVVCAVPVANMANLPCVSASVIAARADPPQNSTASANIHTDRQCRRLRLSAVFAASAPDLLFVGHALRDCFTPRITAAISCRGHPFSRATNTSPAVAATDRRCQWAEWCPEFVLKHVCVSIFVRDCEIFVTDLLLVVPKFLAREKTG